MCRQAAARQLRLRLRLQRPALRRPPLVDSKFGCFNFAVVAVVCGCASAGTLGEFEHYFRLQWGKSPKDHLADAMHAMKAQARTAHDKLKSETQQAGGAQQGKVSGYHLFTSYKTAQLKELTTQDHHALMHECKTPIGEAWLSLGWEDRVHWDNEAKQVNAERCQAALLKSAESSTAMSSSSSDSRPRPSIVQL